MRRRGGEPRDGFLVDLRNYSLHYAIPVMSLATSFQSMSGAGGPMAMNNTVTVDRNELLKWNGWQSKGLSDCPNSPQPNIRVVVPVMKTGARSICDWAPILTGESVGVGLFI